MNAVARGLAAGIAGTAALTLSQRAEVLALPPRQHVGQDSVRRVETRSRDHACPAEQLRSPWHEMAEMDGQIGAEGDPEPGKLAAGDRRYSLHGGSRVHSSLRPRVRVRMVTEIPIASGPRPSSVRRGP